MVNEEHLKILKQGVEVWNRWISEQRLKAEQLWSKLYLAYDLNLEVSDDEANLPYPELPDLSEADLRGLNLQGADFAGVKLRNADFRGANLYKANFSLADLCYAQLDEANLGAANLSGATLYGVAESIADRV